MPEQLGLIGFASAPKPEASALPGDGIERSAEMSLDLKYRWLLRRMWAPGPCILWVMLNPSTADGTEDDPTLRRCIAFSKAWGAGSLEVVNLAALVSSHPDALYDDRVDPIGTWADRYILDAAERCVASDGKMVAGWGASIQFGDFAPFFLRQRDRRVLKMLTSFGDVYCIGRTASGAPIHPMARGRSRVPDDVQPLLFASKGSP